MTDLDDLRATLLARRARVGYNPAESAVRLDELIAAGGRNLAYFLAYEGFAATDSGAHRAARIILTATERE